MANSSKSNNNHHIRSISLPCRSHPSTIRIEDELNKLKTWQVSSTSTAEIICNSLSGLEDPYKCLEDLMNLPLTQQALSHHEHERWAGELLDGSLRLLDICGITRDLLSQIKEHVSDIHSSLRRRKGDISDKSSIAKYTTFRKKMKKESKRLLAVLKQMDKKIENSPLSDLDHHTSSMIRVWREVSGISISVFQTLLLFLSTPVSETKPTRWSLISKLVQKGTVESANQRDNVNEIESVDAALCNLGTYGSSESEKAQIAQSRLESLVLCIEGIESGSECMFRNLIKTRASLLNIISN